MATATASATAGSSLAPFSMVAVTDLYTHWGSRACISALVKTLEPKTSPGSSPVTKLIAGGTYASTLLIACSRTAFPLNGVPITANAPATDFADVDPATVGRFDGKLVTRASTTECVADSEGHDNE